MSYFHFTRGKKIGVLVLSSIILVLVVLLNVNNHVSLPNPFGEIIDTNLNVSVVDSSSDYSKPFLENKKSEVKIEMSNFDPNELDRKGWESKGFSSKQAKSIVDYHSRYGPFKSAADVKKIYVISEDKFNEIEPFMMFDINSKNETLKINVNIASNEELQSIHGIGHYYATKIIDYRDVLGGFVSKDQFDEIKDFRKESLEALKENVVIDNKVNKLKINSITKSELKAHPYFKDWAVVTSIIKKRDSGKIESLSFLLDEGLVEMNQLNKMELYVEYN
jgi:competence ComEA-like helix-hairpin-helix protein